MNVMNTKRGREREKKRVESYASVSVFVYVHAVRREGKGDGQLNSYSKSHFDVICCSICPHKLFSTQRTRLTGLTSHEFPPLEYINQCEKSGFNCSMPNVCWITSTSVVYTTIPWVGGDCQKRKKNRISEMWCIKSLNNYLEQDRFNARIFLLSKIGSASLDTREGEIEIEYARV